MIITLFLLKHHRSTFLWYKIDFLRERAKFTGKPTDLLTGRKKFLPPKLCSKSAYPIICTLKPPVHLILAKIAKKCLISLYS